MLNAVIAGKRRGTGLEGKSFRLGEAQGAEDVLTATVFERLSYLPDEIFSATVTALLGTAFGPVERVSFWPSWYLELGRRVEPDVFLSDGNRTLLVEAKRFDHTRQQFAGQLAAELQAGWLDGCLTHDCILLTLGGLTDLNTSTRDALAQEIFELLPQGMDYKFHLVCTSWQRLFGVLEEQFERYPEPGLQRLLGDIADSYSWHGLRTHGMLWLDSLNPAFIGTHSGAFDHWGSR